ncbi:MAG: LuxR C-terminal-related transcriptional regulator [Verrucomicrobiota bacterium]|nr:LuxR C-terminal-related transcriptional regulator [Verrucomicrobiota bacterium]
MNALRQHDWLRLQEFLLRLHTTSSLSELPATILGGLQEVIPFDSGSLQDDRGGLREIPWLFEEQAWQPEIVAGDELGVRVMSHWEPEFTSMREAFFHASAERHPHSAYYRETGDGAARRLSEIISLRELRQTVFFNEISRQNRLVRQLTIYFPAPPENTVMVALCRESPDFSERDRSLLEMLRPHVATAWRQAWERERHRAEVKRLLDRKSHTAEAIAVNTGLRKRLGITPREAEVLGWVAQGKTNREIAIILGLAAGTVKFYVERILAKLGCETRTAAARTVLEADAGLTNAELPTVS